jgi:hypothetical protein
MGIFNYYLSWVCVCSLRYPASNAHAPYCLLWPVRLYIILPYYLINGTIFGRTLLNIKCVFWFSLQLRNISHSKRNWARCDPKCIVTVAVVRFNETLIFWTDFRKIFKYQISWKSVQWEPSWSMRTDKRRTDMPKLIVVLWNFANAPKKLTMFVILKYLLAF